MLACIYLHLNYLSVYSFKYAVYICVFISICLMYIAISRKDVLSPLMMRIIHWKANVVTASNVLDMSDYALRYCIAIAFVISYIIANIILTHYVY